MKYNAQTDTSIIYFLYRTYADFLTDWLDKDFFYNDDDEGDDEFLRCVVERSCAVVTPLKPGLHK